MLWYTLGGILSAVVFFSGGAAGLSPVVKWIVIGVIWAGSVHMNMRSEKKRK